MTERELRRPPDLDERSRDDGEKDVTREPSRGRRVRFPR